MSDLMTADEAVQYLRLDQQGLRQPREALRWLCRTDKLRSTKIGRRVLFRRQWLDEYIDRHDVAGRSRENCHSG